MAPRMELDILLGGIYRVAIFVCLVIAKGAHQHRTARPYRIRMLTFDLVELFGGVVPAFVLYLLPRVVVDLLDGPLDIFGVGIVVGTVEAEP